MDVGKQDLQNAANFPFAEWAPYNESEDEQIPAADCTAVQLNTGATMRQSNRYQCCWAHRRRGREDSWRLLSSDFPYSCVTAGAQRLAASAFPPYQFERGLNRPPFQNPLPSQATFMISFVSN